MPGFPSATPRNRKLDSGNDMPDGRLGNMAEEWIIRVEGKDYGPATIQALREWKQEGRVLPANEARHKESDVWISASEIPGLFDSDAPSPASSWISPSAGADSRPRARSFADLCRETFRIYATGFWQFLSLALLLVVPLACIQLTSAAFEGSGTSGNELRAVLTGAFVFCMVLFWLFLRPVYITGIQILSAEIAAGRRIGFRTLVNHAVKFWPRIAVLSLFVYGSYLLLTGALLVLIAPIIVGTPSFVSIFLALALLALWVWIIGRLFVNFLFWPQFAVLGGCNVVETLRRSRELARSKSDSPRMKRPLWRGVLIVSIWFAFVTLLDLGAAWPSLRQSFHDLSSASSPDAMMQTFKAASNGRGFDLLAFCLGLWQGLMQPLLGIGFVVLYRDSLGENSNHPPDLE